jgi:hypothetical protein
MNARFHPATLVRACVGMGLLLRPASVLGRDASGRSATVVRVLGARHLLEATIVNVRPTPAISKAGAAVDAIHAVSALAFMAAAPRYRRLALLNAAGATAFALAGVHHARLLALDYPRG